MPLLGPIGGGLAAAGGAGGSAVSAARTTNLDPLLLLLLEATCSTLALEEVAVEVMKQGVSRSPEAADVMLQLAILSHRNGLRVLL